MRNEYSTNRKAPSNSYAYDTIHPMQTFGELLNEYMKRTGISDSELARSIGVQRQTIFRWKEGTVARPRVREDVLHCATRLRLSPEERDLLLLAAGFPPENLATIQPEGQPPINVSSENIPIQSFETTSAMPAQTFASQSQSAKSEFVASETLRPKTAEVSARATPSQWRFLKKGWVGIVGLLLVAILFPLSRWLDNPDTQVTPTPVTVIIDTPPTPTQAPTPPPTATIEQARDGEALILIAEFDNFTGNQGYNIAGRLQEMLMDEVRNNGLKNVRALPLTQNIRSEATAKNILTQSKAALVIWGEYDSGRVVIRYADRNSQRKVEQTLQSVDQLPVVINNDTPKEVKALALATLGQIYRRGGDQQKAKDVLSLALALNPEAKDIRARSLFYLARIIEDEAISQSSKNLLDQTIDTYTELIELNPQPDKDWINVWYNRGHAYYNRSQMASKGSAELLEDLSAAIADYDRAIQILPAYWQALLNRGTAFYDRKKAGDLEKAIADFEAAMAIAPNESSPYFMHGLALLRQSKNDKWEDDFLKVQQMLPNDVNIHVALCWGYVVSNQFDKAKTECEMVRQLSDDDPQHADLQAILLAQNGDLEAATAEASRHLDWIKTQSPQLFENYNGSIVEAWIAQLEDGKNPFDAAMIDRLRLGE